jgi:carbamoyltransferase
MPRNIFEYHPVIGYRFIPGLKARLRHEGGGYLVRCNSMGFRCEHEATPTRPAGTFRILLFGDSNIAGQGVSNRFRFGDLLEQRCPGLQVLNFGLYGSGTDQQYLIYRELAAELEHDLVLICPHVTTIRRDVLSHRVTVSAYENRAVLRPKPYFELEDGELVLRHNPVPREVGVPTREQMFAELDEPPRGLAALMQRLGIDGWLERIRRPSYPPHFDDPQSRVWTMTRAILSRWIEESRAPVAVAPVPHLRHIFGRARADAYLARFSELREHGAEVVDVLPTFRKQDRAVLRQAVFATDEHLNPLAHQLMAQALAPHVQHWMNAMNAS